MNACSLPVSNKVVCETDYMCETMPESWDNEPTARSISVSRGSGTKQSHTDRAFGCCQETGTLCPKFPKSTITRGCRRTADKCDTIEWPIDVCKSSSTVSAKVGGVRSASLGVKNKNKRVQSQITVCCGAADIRESDFLAGEWASSRDTSGRNSLLVRQERHSVTAVLRHKHISHIRTGRVPSYNDFGHLCLTHCQWC